MSDDSNTPATDHCHQIGASVRFKFPRFEWNEELTCEIKLITNRSMRQPHQKNWLVTVEFVNFNIVMTSSKMTEERGKL